MRAVASCRFERTPKVSNEFLINQLCRRTGTVETLPRCFYREPTGAGGSGAPSRSAPIARVLLSRDSLPGLFLLSLPTSVGFFGSSVLFVGATGFNAVGWDSILGVLLALGRGHEKSSARPACAAKASPRLKTFAATGSDVVCDGWSAAPTRSPCSPPPVDRGKTGPTSGLASADPDFGAASGPGSATGAT